MGTRECLKIGFSEVSHSRSWHPGNDRSCHLKLGRDRRRWNPENVLFWGRGRSSGSRAWHPQTTNCDRGRRCRSLRLGGSASFLLQERREARSGLVRSRQVLETQSGRDFVQGRKTLATFEGNNRSVRFRLGGGFWEPEIDLFGPRV